MSTQKPIADNLFTWPSDSPKLIGSKDTETGRYFFPAKNSNQHEKVELYKKILSSKNLNVNEKIIINLINLISKTSGHSGIAGGQYLDLNFEH